MTAEIGGPENGSTPWGVLTQWRTMPNFELVTAAEVQLMQGLAQRVTATRPDFVNSDATFGELAWNWGKGHAADGASRPRRLWFSGGDLVAWSWACLLHRVRRSDGSVKDVTGAYLAYQVHPDHAGLVDEVIDWPPALVFASDGGGQLFAVTGSGRVWRSTTASWFHDFEVDAASIQEFLEHIGRRAAGQD
ncbi:hypothetical protein [Streptomyces sp. NPDC060022]|uniref:hypothetical protein n=1 Tax=Streptomyces sp. NPDC060022 TaxID=3347039 RepID=UPI0036B6D548